jgi:hypothetical protein
MSNVSNVHGIAPFTSGKSVALTGQRLTRISFKQTEKMKAAGIVALPSVCASVPTLTVDALTPYTAELMPHLLALVEKTQDEIIRTKVETSKGQATSVHDDEISVSACIAYLNAESAGSRLSGETIGAWFDSMLNDSLTVVIAEKLGFELSTPEQIATVEKHVKNHRDVLMMLAGKNVILAPRQESAIRNMLALCMDDDDTMAKKLNARFVALTAKPEVEFLI